MKIKKLSIYGYGKWIDRSFSLSPNLHVFYGENEAGKSTLQSFIQSVLFGFPTRHSSSLRYEPKESSRYGGKIYVQDTPFGEAIIERTHGKATGDINIQLADGQEASKEYLDTLLFGVDRELYQSIFSFRLEDLENVEKLTKGQLHRYFLSAGALGSEKFLEEADQLDKQANDLYKPTGRIPIINQKIQVIEEKRQRLNQAKEQNGHYLEVIDTLEKENQFIKKVKQSVQENEKKKQEFIEIEQAWHRVEEMRRLESEIKKIDLPPLPEEGLYTLNRINQERETIQKKVHKQQEKLNEVREEHQPSKAFLVYQEKKEIIHPLRQHLPSIQQKVQEKHFAQKEQKRMETELVQMKIAESLHPNQSAPSEWNPKETMQWRDDWESYRTEEQEINQILANLSYAVETTVSSVDQTEQDLWRSEEFRETKNYYQNEQPKKRKGMYFWLGGVGGISFSLFGYLFLEGLFSWMIVGGGFLFSFLIFYLLRNNHGQNKTDFTYEEFIQQQELRRQWKKQLAQLDTLEEKKREKEKRKKEILKKQRTIEEDFQLWKETNSLPTALSINNCEEKYLIYQKIKKKEQAYEEQSQYIKKIEKEIREKMAPLTFLNDLFPRTHTVEQMVESFGHFLQLVSNEKEQQKEYVNKSEEISRVIKQLLQQDKERIKEKQELLQGIGVDSEEELRKSYAMLQEKKEKQNRLTAMKENQAHTKTDEFATLKEVKNAIEQIERKLRQLKKEEAEAIETKVSLQLEQQKLEEGGEYAALLQEFENERSEFQSLVDEWVSKKLASVIIKNTLNEATQDRLPKVIEDAETYFSYLTENKYKQIILTDDSLIVLDQKGTKMRAEELSRGTAEPLYVSLRLALIKNSQDILSLPIIVDDGFVNFDQRRKQKMYHLLKEVSQFTQVLFFSFDPESFKGLKEDQVTMLQ